MNDFKDFESIFKYRNNITSKTSIFISCEASELQELVDVMAANGYRWCADAIPATGVVERYMNKPLPGLVLYGYNSYYFNETKTIDEDVEYVLKFSELIASERLTNIESSDIFRLLKGT